MQVGTTKDQGSHNKPSAAVHPGALVAGTLPQYNTIRARFKPSLIVLGSNPGLRRGPGNTSVRAVRHTSGEQVRHTQTRSNFRRLAQKLNHNVYNNNDRETNVAEFSTLLLCIMRVLGSNLVPDPATRIATVYLITLQAGVTTVRRATASRHARTLDCTIHFTFFHTTVRAILTDSSFIR